MKKTIVLLFVFLLLHVVGFAQDQINGKVTDEKGEPLVGVVVFVVGTETASVTDMNGQYSIAASKGDKLEFTSLGFDDAVKVVGEVDEINVVMMPSDLFLDEVVVVGYGTQKRSILPDLLPR